MCIRDRSPRVLALRDESRLRLGRLMQKAAQTVSAGACTEVAALRFVDWVEPLLRRESYLALLLERPSVLHRLLRVLGTARWPMQYLMRHPGVIDELADERLLHQRFDRAAFSAELEGRLAAWQRSGEDDEENLLDTLRHAWLLYTSDAADERSSVDLGGRRIIKKKKQNCKSRNKHQTKKNM